MLVALTGYGAPGDVKAARDAGLRRAHRQAGRAIARIQEVLATREGRRARGLSSVAADVQRHLELDVRRRVGYSALESTLRMHVPSGVALTLSGSKPTLFARPLAPTVITALNVPVGSTSL